MTITWNDSVPIYRQLRERVVAMILDGALNEGDPLPSVRQVAADFQINPLTVSKAYQELVDDQLVEKRRGLGMFVTDGAREALLIELRMVGQRHCEGADAVRGCPHCDSRDQTGVDSATQQHGERHVGHELLAY